MATWRINEIKDLMRFTWLLMQEFHVALLPGVANSPASRERRGQTCYPRTPV